MRSLMLFLVCIALLACNNNETRNVAQTPKDGREANLKASIEKYPDSLLLKEELIQYYRENGNYELAIATTNNEILKDSLNARLWDIKANLHYEDDDTLKSIQAYEKAVGLSPEPLYLMALGSVYAQTKNPRALEMANVLLNSTRAKAAKEAFFIIGLYYNYTGEKSKAIGFFDKCLDLDYTYMFAYREKAIALYDQGKFEQAIPVLNKAVTLQNSFDEGYYWLGRSHEQLKQIPKAIENYQLALSYNPEYIEAKQALGKLGIK